MKKLAASVLLVPAILFEISCSRPPEQQFLTQFFRAVGGAIGLSVMGAVMAQRLHAGGSPVEALHGVFTVGLVICLAALAAAFLVPPGRAHELARAEPRAAGG